ncbi:hypothetical protein ACLOJK_031872 [Asimina triloba]
MVEIVAPSFGNACLLSDMRIRSALEEAEIDVKPVICYRSNRIAPLSHPAVMRERKSLLELFVAH